MTAQFIYLNGWLPKLPRHGSCGFLYQTRLIRSYFGQQVQRAALADVLRETVGLSNNRAVASAWVSTDAHE